MLVLVPLFVLYLCTSTVKRLLLTDGNYTKGGVRFDNVTIGLGPLEPGYLKQGHHRAWLLVESEDGLKDLNLSAAVVAEPGSGGCKMAKGQEHNLIGTRRLMDALLPTGCRRFIIASSIGAVGTGMPHHPPKQLPMPDEEPYGGFPWPYALTKFQV